MSTDDRDPQLRARLEVEPLDDVTRRRLVRRALDETATAPIPSRQGWTRRWLPAAAAVLLVLAVGGTVTAILRNDDSGTTTASNEASSESRADDAVPAPAQEDQSLAEGGASSVAVPTNLGDLGAAPSFERLSARAERALATESPASETEAFGAGPCADQLEPAVAVATGAIDGQIVTLLVYDDRILVVDATTCETVSEAAR